MAHGKSPYANPADEPARESDVAASIEYLRAKEQRKALQAEQEFDEQSQCPC